MSFSILSLPSHVDHSVPLWFRLPCLNPCVQLISIRPPKPHPISVKFAEPDETQEPVPSGVIFVGFRSKDNQDKSSSAIKEVWNDSNLGVMSPLNEVSRTVTLDAKINSL